MHRLFVAIRPPASIRERLLGIMGGVSGVRWQTGDQLHLTLRFIGEVDRHQTRDIAAALHAIRHPGLHIALDGVGTFTKRKQAETLWVGVTPHEPLMALHNKINQLCIRMGLEPERRTYHPHITLARLGPKAGPIDDFLNASGGISSQLFLIDSFGLYESDLAPTGAFHSLVERYCLD